MEGVAPQAGEAEPVGSPGSPRGVKRKATIPAQDPPACEPPLFGLDPQYWCNTKIFARTLLRLPPFSNFPGSVQLFGHPLRSVQLMGCVVRLHTNHQRTMFMLDDGSALMPCIWWQDAFERKYGAGCRISFEAGSGAPFQLGDYISVCGQVKWYQSELQLRVETAWAERDPNAEALWHAEVVHLTSTWIRSADAPARLSADQASNASGPSATPASRGSGVGTASSAVASTSRPVDRSGANAGVSAHSSKLAVDGHPPAAQSAPDFQNSPFVDAMRIYVRNRVEFSFTDLRATPELRQAAEAALASMPARISARAMAVPAVDGSSDANEAASGSAATEMRVAHLFSKCIGLLAAEGVVYLKDAAADVYRCVSMEVIASALGDVMSDAASRRPEYEEDGVPLDEITDGLIHHRALASACLTRGQARRHVAAAVDASIIYEANYKRYKQSL